MATLKAASTVEIIGRVNAAIMPHKLNHAEQLAKWQGVLEIATDIACGFHTASEWETKAHCELSKLRLSEVSLPSRNGVRRNHIEQGQAMHDDPKDYCDPVMRLPKGDCPL